MGINGITCERRVRDSIGYTIQLKEKTAHGGLSALFSKGTRKCPRVGQREKGGWGVSSALQGCKKLCVKARCPVFVQDVRLVNYR